MTQFKVALVEQSLGVPYLYTCIKFDSSTDLFCLVEGDTFTDALNRDLEFRPFYPPIELGLRSGSVSEKTSSIMSINPFDRPNLLGFKLTQEQICEMIVLPVPALGDDHFIVFCSNMKLIYKNLYGGLTQLPINLAQACDVSINPTRSLMAMSGFGEIIGVLADAELL